MSTIAIIQARFSSSRLPGKVLQDLAGKSLLAWTVDRAARASLVDRAVVATTSDAADDPVAEECVRRGYAFYRGSQYDVLDRYYQAALTFGAQTIVRITADCPLIDPQEIDRVIRLFRQSGADFACNRLPPPWKRTTPIGLDTEVCSFAGLERAWREASQKHEREHVMPYFYDCEGRFKVAVADMQPDASHFRWTVDTPEDLTLLREISARFPGNAFFAWQEVAALFEREPQLARINAHVQHKSGLEFDTRAG